MTTRLASVAGKFYPRNKYDLSNLIKEIRKAERKNINYNIPLSKIIGGIVPHAGYEYSGYEAIHFFEILRKSKQRFDTIVIINPNHTGYGANISLDQNSYWETPLGKVPVDIEFQELLGFEKSEEAHKYEHSAEVIIPFLQQTLSFKFNIVPISIMDQNLTNAREIAASVFEVSQRLDRKVLVIASSDFSHFVSPDEGIEQDNYAIEHIMRFNSEELVRTVNEKRISMCGCATIMSLLEFALIASVNPKIELLSRGNSFKRYPSMEVVDYVSFLVYE